MLTQQQHEHNQHHHHHRHNDESLDNTTKERDELKAKLETATDDLEISCEHQGKDGANEKLQDQVKVLASDLSSTTRIVTRTS